MDFYHGQIIHLQRNTAADGQVPKKLSQGLFRATPAAWHNEDLITTALKGTGFASGLLLMNFPIQSWPRGCASNFAHQLELITSQKSGFSLQEACEHTLRLRNGLISCRNKIFLQPEITVDQLCQESQHTAKR